MADIFALPESHTDAVHDGYQFEIKCSDLVCSTKLCKAWMENHVINDCKFIPARSESVISDSEMTVYCRERDVSSDDNSSASTPTTTYFQDFLDDKKELHIVEIPDIVSVTTNCPILVCIHRTSPN